MNDLKTPVSRLWRLFRDARDRWKAKALERQKRVRAAHNYADTLQICIVAMAAYPSVMSRRSRIRNWASIRSTRRSRACG